MWLNLNSQLVDSIRVRIWPPALFGWHVNCMAVLAMAMPCSTGTCLGLPVTV